MCVCHRSVSFSSSTHESKSSDPSGDGADGRTQVSHGLLSLLPQSHGVRVRPRNKGPRTLL